MSEAIRPAESTRGREYLVYDAARVSAEQLGEFFAARQAAGFAGGRAAVSLVTRGDQGYVVRRYHRGGLPARLSRQSYLWSGWHNSRPWCEWQLLAQLYTDGLPVPRPVAARAERRRLSYSAQLVTELLPATVTLTATLRERALDAAQWRRIGATIRRFHRWGADHADLNADNLLLDAGGMVWLIDFDRGCRRQAAGAWCQRNLSRLQRSLVKQRSRYDLSFADPDWAALLDGYRAASDAAAGSDSSTVT